jgi:hypothetical protein
MERGLDEAKLELFRLYDCYPSYLSRNPHRVDPSTLSSPARVVSRHPACSGLLGSCLSTPCSVDASSIIGTLGMRCNLEVANSKEPHAPWRAFGAIRTSARSGFGGARCPGRAAPRDRPWGASHSVTRRADGAGLPPPPSPSHAGPSKLGLA